MKFEYSPEISLGNLMQIVTIVLGIGAGYGALVQANAVQDQILQQLTNDIQEIRMVAKEERKEIKEEVKSLSSDIRSLDNKLTDYVLRSAQPTKR
jgi:siroheme synthase (precorrin-2 oxidase/ferrochelatase)